MKKYTKYFKRMMLVAASLAALACAAVLDNEPTLCAMLSVSSFIIWFSGIAAPDSEKFTPQYLRSHKGWS